MPLTVHLCLLVTSALLLFLCSARSCLGTKHQDCLYSTSMRCGGVEFSYPSVKKDSRCGEPDFHFECDLDVPVREIGQYIYSLWPPGSVGEDRSHTLTIFYDSFQDNNLCNTAHSSQTVWQGSQFFHIGDGYTNVTIWNDCDFPEENFHGFKVLHYSKCHYDWYYSVNSGLDSQGGDYCQTYFQLPIPKDHPPLNNIDDLLRMGFNITWYYDPSNGGSNKAIIIGCSIGGSALTILALLLFLMFYRKRKQPPPPPTRTCNSVSKVEKFLKEYAYEMPTRYSQSDLKKMTSNFAEKLGEGGYGVVYKGKLQNGALVAVKLLDRHRHSENQFMNEVATIGRVHHVNLVRLLGYCFESFTSALVYEFMANGSLEKFLFAGKEKEQVLRWEQLCSIALGAARGIAYLHQDCDKRIVHFDIKPHNILLDSDFTPEVADFGLAKLCGKGDDHISMTGARGTPGYVAPEVWSGDLGPVTDKSDVYSFGMLLLEIVGGRKNIDVQVSRSSQLYFPEWAFKLLESGELGMRLRGGRAMEVEDEEKARGLTKIGLWCVQYNYRDRPCMSRVVQMLEGNGDDVSTPTLPFNSSAEPVNPLASSTVTSSIEIRL